MKLSPRVLAALLPALFVAPAVSLLTPVASAQTPAALPAAAPQPTTTPLQTLADFSRFFGREVALETLQSAAPTAGATWQKTVDAARAAKLPFTARRVSLDELRRSGDLALLRLQAPAGVAILEALGSQHALLYENGRDALLPVAELKSRFSGEALLLENDAATIAPRLVIGEPVRVAKLTSIGGDSELVETVSVKNEGNASLTLSVASTSCGCTGATVTPLLAPGQSGTVTMKMRAEGSRLVTVNLKSNDPRRAWAILALQAQMPQTVIVPPPAIAASTRASESWSQRVEFALPAGIAVENVSASQPFVTARLAAPNALEVTVGKDAPPGAFSDRIVMTLRGGEMRQMMVPLSGYVSDDVVAEPSLIALGSVPAGATIHKVVVLQGAANKPFSILSSSGSSAGVSAKASAEVVASAHAVEVEIKVGDGVGAPIQERLTLLMWDKRTLDVDVFGTIAAPDAASTRTATTALQVGQVAPDFALRDMNGALQTLAARRRQRNLLLTFFPKCFTGGCANHLSSLRDVKAQLDAAQTDVLAVSVDPADGEKGQKAFAAQWQLNFPLLPDTDRKLSLLYGAAQTPTDLDSRMTVLIDKSGIIRWIDRDVNVKTHGADVLAKMRELGMMK